MIEKVKIFVVDDHAVVRQGIKMMIGTDPAIELLGEAEDGRSAVNQCNRLQPDVVLMDLVMPRFDGIKAIGQVKQNCPGTKIIVLTTFEDDDRVHAAIQAGADGYILKDADGEALLQAIKSAWQGEMPLHPRVASILFRGHATEYRPDLDKLDGLTDREKEVLALVVKGLSNREVAERLCVSEGTVKVHVSNILSKLNFSSRTEAAVWAVQVGLVSLDA